ncbi:MAG TPA: FAD-dependent oxidoreductase [Bryobacteraceae bacterium]|jgi:2-polyprenyl-6-methoxyphenol hydroxylase-like FAD-dependent oxidoreductase
METQVLIIGAGPTGLALACDLARRGVAFRIVDKAADYFAGSRGKGLQPRSLEVLDDLGVVDEIIANGRFHLPFRGYEGTKVLGDRDPHEGREPTPDVPYSSTLIIPQWRVEEILRKRLAGFGCHVELATELTGFEQNEETVIAALTNEVVTAQYMLGADGGRSFVRGALGVGFEGETWKSERMLIGDVQTDELDRDHWHSWLSTELGGLALCPLPSTNSFQLQAMIGPDEPEQPSLERLQQIVDERAPGMGIRLHHATWLSLYRANVRMVDRYRVGRVFLAGDAAHVHSPAGGQGMNTGIQDAYNLGWKLSAVLRGAPAALLDTYEEERLPVAAWMLGVTSRLHRDSLHGDVKNAQRGPETLQLGISYHENSLAREERSNPGTVQAGDRAPDSPCQNPDGTSARLFDIFRGPHFTLLGFGAFNRTIFSEIQQVYGGEVCTYAVTDVDSHAHRAYDIQNDALVLVRPDGYIGLMTDGASAKGLREYLAMTLQIT